MYYPVMINLKDKNVLIVGGGKVALRKLKNILNKTSFIKILSPKFEPEFEKLNVELIYDTYETRYLENVDIVITATSSKDINDQIVNECKKRNILVNSSSSKDGSDFITPSVVDTGSLLFAISSKGSFPSLSKYIRKDLEDRYKKFDEEFVNILEDIRKITLERYRDQMDEIFYKSLRMDIDELRQFYLKLLED